MTSKNTVFGIDLGTTYSAIAYVDEYDIPRVVNNMENTSTTPSVVYFESSTNVIVGQASLQSGRVDPKNYVELIKRSMGNPDHRLYLHGEELRPEQISALILGKLKKDTEEALASQKITVRDVVITVPAYFDAARRTATEQAGQLAGLNVLGIIPEPTAAAIAYAATDEDDQTFIVYDLGGGTFDVTVMKVEGSSVEVLGIEGNHDLGGRNWDEAVVNWLALQWQEQTASPEDPLNDMETSQELFTSAEEAKRSLSRLKVKEVPLKVVHAGLKTKGISLTRDKFNELTADRLELTISLTKQAIANAGHPKIDRILLVGGSSYMPQVQERLQSEFPDIEQALFNPDQCVALGAAIYANNKQIRNIWENTLKERYGEKKAEDIITGKHAILPEEQSKVHAAVAHTLPGATHDQIAAAVNTRITNASSKNFGIQVLNELDQPYIEYLIKRNTQVPATNQQQFYTQHPNQSTVEIKIFEADGKTPPSDPTHAGCVLMKDFELDLPPGMPKSHPIDVAFSLSEDGGRLRIEAEDKINGLKLDEIIQTTGALMPEELDEMKKAGLKISIN